MNAIAKRDLSIIGADIRKGDECKLDIHSTNPDNSIIMRIYRYGTAAFKEYINHEHIHDDWLPIDCVSTSEE